MRIISVLIVVYVVGSFFNTVADLAALKSAQAATSQPSEPLHRGGTNRR